MLNLSLIDAKAPRRARPALSDGDRGGAFVQETGVRNGAFGVLQEILVERPKLMR